MSIRDIHERRRGQSDALRLALARQCANDCSGYDYEHANHCAEYVIRNLEFHSSSPSCRIMLPSAIQAAATRNQNVMLMAASIIRAAWGWSEQRGACVADEFKFAPCIIGGIPYDFHAMADLFDARPQPLILGAQCGDGFIFRVQLLSDFV